MTLFVPNAKILAEGIERGYWELNFWLKPTRIGNGRENMRTEDLVKKRGL